MFMFCLHFFPYISRRSLNYLMFLVCYFSSKSVKLRCHYTDRKEHDGEEAGKRKRRWSKSLLGKSKRQSYRNSEDIRYYSYKDDNKMVQSVLFQVKKNHVFQTIIFKESSKQKLHSCRWISRIHLFLFCSLVSIKFPSDSELCRP